MLPMSRLRSGIRFFDWNQMFMTMSFGKRVWCCEIMGPNSRKSFELDNYPYLGYIRYPKRMSKGGKKKKVDAGFIYKYPDHEAYFQIKSMHRCGMRTMHWHYHPDKGWKTIPLREVVLKFWPSWEAYRSEAESNIMATYDNPFFYGSRPLGFPYRIRVNNTAAILE